MVKKQDAGSKAEHHYFRVVVTYSDGETSANRVFKDRGKAETFAARQKKSPVVKKTVIEPFVCRCTFDGGYEIEFPAHSADYASFVSNFLHDLGRFYYVCDDRRNQ